MAEEELLEKSNAIFANLINLTNEELNSQGFTVPPSLIIEKIVSPVKELYIKKINYHRPCRWFSECGKTTDIVLRLA